MSNLVKKLFLTFAVSTIMGTFVQAGTMGSQTGKVTRLYVSGNYAYVELNKNMKNFDCKPVSGVYATLLKSHNNYDSIYSLLLSARVSNRDVKVRIKNGTNNCEVAYVVL